MFSIVPIPPKKKFLGSLCAAGCNDTKEEFFWLSFSQSKRMLRIRWYIMAFQNSTKSKLWWQRILVFWVLSFLLNCVCWLYLKIKSFGNGTSAWNDWCQHNVPVGRVTVCRIRIAQLFELGQSVHISGQHFKMCLLQALHLFSFFEEMPLPRTTKIRFYLFCLTCCTYFFSQLTLQVSFRFELISMFLGLGFWELIR